MSEGKRLIPVWFFVGVLLVIYGALILISGIMEWSHPPGTVLASLHASVWWGGLMVVMGALFIRLFMPRKSSR